MIEENKPEESTGPGELNDILDPYLKPKRLQPRFWVWVFLAIAAVVMAMIFKKTVVDPTIKPSELVSSIEMCNLDSQWVVSEKLDTKEFKGIILVPQISFIVRNVGQVILKDVYFLGVFRLLDSAQNLGEGFEMTFKKPLYPGQESERIVLSCQFGYRASSKMAFKTNSKDWRSALVQIFAKTGSSQLMFLKTFYISRKIEGLDMDIKLTGKTAEELIGAQTGQEKKDSKQ